MSENSNQLIAEIHRKTIEIVDDVSGVKKDLAVIKEGQKYTNGKVATLMEDKIRREEREKVEKQFKSVKVNQQIETQIVQKRWFDNENLVKGVVAILLGLAAVLTALINKFLGSTGA